MYKYAASTTLMTFEVKMAGWFPWQASTEEPEDQIPSMQGQRLPFWQGIFVGKTFAKENFLNLLCLSV